MLGKKGHLHDKGVRVGLFVKIRVTVIGGGGAFVGGWGGQDGKGE